LPGQNLYDDRLVTQYLLGSTSGEETDRLDELSLTDDEFAARLDLVENDLVDAYVKGQLGGETLERFESFYLGSPRRQEKVRFAEALAKLTDRPVAAAVSSKAARHQWTLAWSFAGVAALLLLAASYLLYENRRIQSEVAEERSRSLTLEKRALELQQRLDRYGTPATAPTPTPPGVAPPTILAFLLSPQTRGIGSVAGIVLPTGIDIAAFQLRLESNDFSGFRAALRDAASNQIVWRSGGLKAQSKGNDSVVTVNLPTRLLKAQNYILEVNGVAPGDKEELVNTYAFRVAAK